MYIFERDTQSKPIDTRTEYCQQKSIQLLMSSTSKYKSTPTYTIKARNRGPTQDMYPSPQLYNPEKRSLKKAPTVKFAQSKRMEWAEIQKSQFRAGPGSHQAPSFITAGVKGTIGRARLKQQNNFNPSPNHYNVFFMAVKPKAASYSIQQKTESIQDSLAIRNSDEPAPGSYEQPVLKFASSPSIKMSKALRSSNVSLTPGPGKYDSGQAYSKSVASRSIRCKLAKSIRKIDFSEGQRSPGPGAYRKKSFLGDHSGRSVTLGQRRNSIIGSSNNPGPSHYSPLLNKYKSVSCPKIPKALRNSFTDQSIKEHQTPGPGSHDTEIFEKIKFRSLSVNKFSRSPTNLQKHSIDNSDQVSPFRYSPSLSNARHVRAPMYSFNSKTKKSMFLKNPQTGPGPAEYEPKTSLLHDSESAPKIPRSVRPDPIKHTLINPGPGSYPYQTEQRLGRPFKFSKQPRNNYMQEKINKESSTMSGTYAERQSFPNPPKYMNASPKLRFNPTTITNS